MATQTSSLLELHVSGRLLHICGGGNDGFWREYEQGAWEPDTRAVFERFLDARHSYVDMGAWVGPTLLLGSPLARRCYGIEADPVAFAELRENIEANRPLTDNVELFHLCIAAESGPQSFGSRGAGGDSTSSLLFAGEKTVWTVDGSSFGNFVERNNIQDCNFIKIDIEGGEYSVLPTMATYLKQHRPTLLLSLHPCFVGQQQGVGAMAGLRRSWERLRNTLRLLPVLLLYRHCYDPRGHVPSGIDTFRSRLRDRLAAIRWKPAVLLLTCLYSMGGGSDTLVLTEERW